jgi:glycosyltransferase involved in cell wall biosynthesis
VPRSQRRTGGDGASADQPILSTVVLNWNRQHLLRVTIESYLATVTVPYELIVVDNASTDGSVEYIREICQGTARHRAVFLPKNRGGRALNAGLRLARGRFLHTSENDIEYLAGWDAELLGKFDAFPELGQLSPFGFQPDRDKGELWERIGAAPLTRDGRTIYVTETNITTTAICRREVWDRGFRWGTVRPVRGQPVRFPSDMLASIFVRDLGYLVAWNDRYTVVNWGHNVEEWRNHLDYYLGNYRAKPWLGLVGMRERLRAHGFDLVDDGGQQRIVARAGADVSVE